MMKQTPSTDRLKKYQEWLRIGKAGMKGVWDEADACDRLVESKAEKNKVKVRFLKKVAQISVDKVYPRNPSFRAEPKRPVPSEEPVIDPMTGMPAVDPATGTFAEPPDVSLEGAEVVVSVMNHILEEINFKAEARAWVRDAITRPAGVLQLGYEYDQWRQLDDAYARRRSIKDVVVDPYASLYHGVLRDCRYIAVQLKLTEEDAELRGLDIKALPETSIEIETAGGDKDRSSNLPSDTDKPKRYAVWELWDSTDRMVAYVPESGDKFPAPPKDWPWGLPAFPFVILQFDCPPDKLWGHSLVYDLQEQQVEMNSVRTSMHEQVVRARPRTLYDTQIIPPEKMAQISDAPKNSFIGIQGLAAHGGADKALQHINPEGDISGLQTIYEMVKAEVQDVAGVSDNDRLQGTNMTASEANIIDSASKMLSGAKIDSVDDSLGQAFKILKIIVQATYDEPRVARITGPRMAEAWIEWTGADLLQGYDVYVEAGSGRQNSELEKQVALNMLEVLLKVPGADVVEAAKEVLRKHGEKNPDRFFPAPPPGAAMGPMGPEPGPPGAPVAVGPDGQPMPIPPGMIPPGAK